MNFNLDATEIETHNRKQKLDNIINKITEGQLSKIREAATLAIENAAESDQERLTINLLQSSDNTNETDKAKSTEKIEKEGGEGRAGGSKGEGEMGLNSDHPAPTGHGANM